MQEQNQRTSPWLIAWRVIFTFALIGCIVFIFSNSLQIADVSEGASGRVLGILQGILRHLGLPGAADRLTMHIVRKLAHFCEYLLEGFLLMLCLRVYTRHFFKHVSWPMLGGLLYDEAVDLLEGIAQLGEVICVDLVEVSPPYDDAAGTTCYLAARILADFLGFITKERERRGER